ncbi:MAG: YkgJ family cysteine cluster protein, partial [Pseudomonas fluorescens]|nr:YkgJ family cysteine cluster protein [Pseudomonas fluorescens]
LALDQPSVASEWVFHASGLDIAEQLLDAGAQIATEVPANYAFISLRAA